MSRTAQLSVSMVFGLALAIAVGGADRPTLGDEPAGPRLVLPSPPFGNRLIPENLASDLIERTSEPEMPEEPALPAEPDSTVPDVDATPMDDEPAEPEEGADAAAADGDAAADVDNDDEPEAAEPDAPRRELSPAVAALRDQVRRTLAAHQGQALSTAENTVTEVMYACRAFGCDTEVFEAVALRQKLNGITCLTWNYPCAGFAPLTLSDGHLAGRVGYGYQEYPGQLLSTLALARVSAGYPARVGDDVRTVADLVEYEKLACREGTDKSAAMIGLMYYVGPDSDWQNRLGEQWSIEKILEEELAKPVIGAPWGGTRRLMGLSYVVRRRTRRDEPLEGPYRRAQDYLRQFHDHAFAVQNDDGSWGPRYLAARSASSDPGAALGSTGRILEWLAFSLPEERLAEPGVLRAVHWVDRILRSGRYAPQNTKSLRTEEIGAVMHALAALRRYDVRFFRPADPPAEQNDAD